MVDMSIGERLKRLRDEAGLDQVQAAAVAGTTKQAVSQIENGRTKVPGGIYLYQWAKRYGVDLEWLITGKGSPVGQSQPPRLDAEIILAAIKLAKKSVRLGANEVLDIERSPEEFAAALRNAIALRERLEAEHGVKSGSGDRQAGGAGGPAV